MKVLSVSCNNCGAALEVAPTARYITCAFCDSRLEVHKSGSAYYTDVLEAVGGIRADVATIKVQNEIERLDREWAMERERWSITDRHGRTNLPGPADLLVPWVVAVLGSGVALVAWGAGGWLVVVPTAAVAWLVARQIGERYRSFEASKRRYAARRRELTRELRKS